MTEFIVRGAPGTYICEDGILGRLEEHLLSLGYGRILIVHGRDSWKAAASYFPEFQTLKADFIEYSGECSLAEIQRVAESSIQADAILGVGGGKILDLVKAAGQVRNIETVLLPTAPSNCSAWTPISVIYTEEGNFHRFDIHSRNASLLIIEPQIMLEAPTAMLVAGIGDTVAKWYEADVQIRQLPEKTAALAISHYTAKLCLDELIEHGGAAVAAAERGELTARFVKVVETIIMTGGMVGGFGDSYGRVAAAHSIHNGLTVLPETHSIQHGEKVAYGTLIQLILEDRWEEAEKLAVYFQQLGLPISLRDMGLSDISDEGILAVAEKTTKPGETIHLLKTGGVTAEEVAQAIRVYEKHQTIVQ
ncbi:iron-containing alcohol dehydrogenase family protein [Planococcus halotolerans]|uniref:Oxidoreductase n=1 Tax=Planococcus halotolerans TaxID=2233542 RepID=A0A365L6E8_9BACL|nr:iron-containing alcohol dehydrogenase family protein [Planococcus halotolerans]QHJ70284.1 iron-containing alcohol dehydrogenase [Planococcus halotolerans]RAZ80986.1 oxidoreductase [Planococcus halotolerans]